MSIANEIVKRTIKADGTDRYQVFVGASMILQSNHPPTDAQLQAALQAHRERNRPGNSPLDGV